MPVNIHTDEMNAWKYIKKIIDKNIIQDYNYLVLTTIQSHPVGAKQVDNHIKRFYIDAGEISIEEGLIIKHRTNRND